MAHRGLIGARVAAVLLGIGAYAGTWSPPRAGCRAAPAPLLFVAGPQAWSVVSTGTEQHSPAVLQGQSSRSVWSVNKYVLCSTNRAFAPISMVIRRVRELLRRKQ
jgi:hypothetical protein